MLRGEMSRHIEIIYNRQRRQIRLGYYLPWPDGDQSWRIPVRFPARSTTGKSFWLEFIISCIISSKRMHKL